MDIAIKAIYISAGHDFVGRHGKNRLEHGIEKVASVECLAGRGLANDRYLDHKENFKGQITFFDWTVYIRIKEQCGLPDLDPALFRRNILTSGSDLNHLIGQRFSIQGIEFEGVEECRPCYWMDQAIAPGAEDYLKGHGGLRARILSGGILRLS
jgi:MOSC domain-containing protein YiiM